MISSDLGEINLGQVNLGDYQAGGTPPLEEDFSATLDFSGALLDELPQALSLSASLSFSAVLSAPELEALTAAISFLGDLEILQPYVDLDGGLSFAGELSVLADLSSTIGADVSFSGDLGLLIVQWHPPTCIPVPRQPKSPVSAIKKEPNERKGT